MNRVIKEQVLVRNTSCLLLVLKVGPFFQTLGLVRVELREVSLVHFSPRRRADRERTKKRSKLVFIGDKTHLSCQSSLDGPRRSPPPPPRNSAVDLSVLSPRNLSRRFRSYSSSLSPMVQGPENDFIGKISEVESVVQLKRGERESM